LKTRQPLILTASVAERDIEPFHRLRQRHFPPDRNFLGAHLTMFYRLPGEHRDRIGKTLTNVAARAGVTTAKVSSLRHLGAGVAFVVTCPDLEDIRASLKAEFVTWLGSQDMQTWRPHITIQNKVPRATADALYRDLTASLEPHTIEILGLDLWNYLGGPWEHLAFAPFDTRPGQ
jgi:hypothetical protein